MRSSHLPTDPPAGSREVIVAWLAGVLLPGVGRKSFNSLWCSLVGRVRDKAVLHIQLSWTTTQGNLLQMNPGVAPEAQANTDLKQDTWELFILQVFFFLFAVTRAIFQHPLRKWKHSRGWTACPAQLWHCPACWDTGACPCLSNDWSDLNKFLRLRWMWYSGWKYAFTRHY